MENEEQKPEEIIEEKSEVDPSEQQEENKADRPERNYKAELARKDRELERLRQEAEVNRSRGDKRDANDLSTWADHELKSVVNSNDPTALPFKDQANDILFERKVNSIRERERMQEKRVHAEMELRSKYPEALDPTSELAIKMDQLMYDLDLQKSPSGRLAAAKLAAAELGKGHSKAVSLERKNEEARLNDVKSQMVDGNRSRPQESNSNSPKKKEELEARIKAGDSGAVGEVLKSRGISRDTFFKK